MQYLAEKILDCRIIQYLEIEMLQKKKKVKRKLYITFSLACFEEEK